MREGGQRYETERERAGQRTGKAAKLRERESEQDLADEREYQGDRAGAGKLGLRVEGRLCRGVNLLRRSICRVQ